MAIRRPPTTFSDSITGADLASDIAISTTGNIATTGSGTLTVAGNTTLSGTNNLGSNPTITLGGNATFPAGMVVNVASNSATNNISSTANNGYSHAVDLIKVSWQLKTTNPLLVAYFHCQTGSQNSTASWNMDFIYDTNTTNSGFSYSSSNLFSGDSTAGSFYSYYSDGDPDRRRAKILNSLKVITGTAGHYCEVKAEAWGTHSRVNAYNGFKTITVFEVAQ